ncbi:hypothetical protein, partial [Cupriavidus gilardii]|uniref:hypothetical protein n=1 Tax=Cupriavidus gilardii TaxID=82541 RepID=UPI001243BBC6
MSRFGPEPAGISAQRESDFVAGWNAAIAQAGLMEDDVARLSEELAGMLPSKRIHALRALLSRAAPSAQQAEPDGIACSSCGLTMQQSRMLAEQPAEEA